MDCFQNDSDLRHERVKTLFLYQIPLFHWRFEINRRDFLRVKIDSGTFIEMNFCGCFRILAALYNYAVCLNLHIPLTPVDDTKRYKSVFSYKNIHNSAVTTVQKKNTVILPN